MTKIAWTEKTWNPVTGCTKVSDGCKFCYASKMAKRLRGRHGYPADDPFKVTLRPERLDQPMKWRDPRKVFVCSMGDLFHMDVPDEFIDRVFATMALANKHTFQVLTKRPERMAAYLAHESYELYPQWGTAAGCLHDGDSGFNRNKKDRKRIDKFISEAHGFEYFEDDSECAESFIEDELPWPIKNLWLGTSVEDQATFDERVPHLLKCPAAVRFLSIEPLLGSIAIGDIKGIDWVIIGCESKGAWNGRTSSDVKDPVESRMCWEARANNIINLCIAQRIPVFVKQIPGLDGKAIKNMAKFPKSLQFQQYPEVKR